MPEFRGHLGVEIKNLSNYGSFAKQNGTSVCMLRASTCVYLWMYVYVCRYVQIAPKWSLVELPDALQSSIKGVPLGSACRVLHEISL